MIDEFFDSPSSRYDRELTAYRNSIIRKEVDKYTIVKVVNKHRLQKYGRKNRTVVPYVFEVWSQNVNRVIKTVHSEQEAKKFIEQTVSLSVNRSPEKLQSAMCDFIERKIFSGEWDFEGCAYKIVAPDVNSLTEFKVVRKEDETTEDYGLLALSAFDRWVVLEDKAALAAQAAEKVRNARRKRYIDV